MRYTQLVESTAKDIAVFYGGRFQPIHSGHYQVYRDLVNRFGANNVFIATTYAKSATADKDPFSFVEKQQIMNRMFGIPQNRIINTQPYRPDVSLTGKDPSTTATILVYSEKDAGRLQYGGFLRPYKDGVELVSSDEGAYVYIVDVKDDGRSATTFRDAMRSENFNDEEKKRIFKDFFGKFDPEMYKFILGKLNVNTNI